MQPNARKDFFSTFGHSISLWRDTVHKWILILLLFPPTFFSYNVQSCCFFHFLSLSLVTYWKSPSTFVISWLLFMVITVPPVLAASVSSESTRSWARRRRGWACRRSRPRWPTCRSIRLVKDLDLDFLFELFLQLVGEWVWDLVEGKAGSSSSWTTGWPRLRRPAGTPPPALTPPIRGSSSPQNNNNNNSLIVGGGGGGGVGKGRG